MKREIISITIDEKTLKKLDAFSAQRALSRSGAIRFIVNDYFLKNKEWFYVRFI